MLVVKKAFIILGLGFGDEGKGMVSNHFCKKFKESIVIRFNGGQQAGHSVLTKDGKKHVYSNFGSGTDIDTPTFWSKYCCFSPELFLKELSKIYNPPSFLIDKNCHVTTHYDILFNRAEEISLKENRIGTTGSGYRSTVERSPKIPLIFSDLQNKKVLQEKLKTIRNYYRLKINKETDFNFENFQHDEEDIRFYKYCEKIKNLIEDKKVVPTDEAYIFNRSRTWSYYIFEGAQGILLDQKFGSKPFITKSNTTSRNAFEMLSKNKLLIETQVIYVTRAYQTRHGIGPFPNKHEQFSLINNRDETNQFNTYQGEFKANFLNIDSINYALDCDQEFSKNSKKSLVMTCLDHFDSKEDVRFFENDKLVLDSYENLIKRMNVNFKDIFYSFSPDDKLQKVTKHNKP